MGRAILAFLSEDQRRGYLKRLPERGPSASSITDPSRLEGELTKIRGQGWALVDQELEEGLRSVAVPLRDRTGAWWPR